MNEAAAIAKSLSGAGGAYVAYDFECARVQDLFSIEHFIGVEELNRPYRVELTLRAADEHGDAGALLGKSARVTITRPDYHRSFSGIVSRVVLRDSAHEMQRSTVTLVPALTALTHTKQTCIFQSKTAVEILTEVLTSSLAIYEREVDLAGLESATYQTREFCVQYQETNLDFVHRLMEEEGIGYRFVEGDVERLVLFDDNRDMPRAEPRPIVIYDPAVRDFQDHEPVVRFEPAHAYGSPRLTIRDHDWTQRQPTLEESSELGDTPRHEVYEHGLEHHVSITEDAAEVATLVAVAEGAIRTIVESTVTSKVLAPDLPGISIPSFTSDDSGRQLRIRQELLHRDGLTAQGTSMVVGLGPGVRFTLGNHPQAGVDGDYYAVKVTHRSDPSEGERSDDVLGTANYRNDFECLPYSVPWRPARATQKPRIYGVQTATVTGPVGMDVYTDQHGRIKAKFNWDRAPQNIGGNDSAWIRVGQTWAGDHGPGFLFIPRVGMEVIVTFVDGDPDRPMVIGCVHNGANSTPTPVPFKATKSVIRTRTVPHGPGYNEISFEDAMGMEQIHIRAERDLTEHVLQDHLTVVARNAHSAVGGDEITVVEGTQYVHASNGRHTSVTGSDTAVTKGRSHVTVSGSSHRFVGCGEETIVLNGDHFVHTREGRHIVTARREVELESREFVRTRVGNATIHVSNDSIVLQVGQSKIEMTPDWIRLNQKTIPAGST